MERKTLKKFMGLSLLVVFGLGLEAKLDRDNIIYQEYLSRQKEIGSYTIKETRNIFRGNFDLFDYSVFFSDICPGCLYLAYNLKKD
ncbi:MAG: hypothetical protein AABX77_03695 [Nanoarchaeota archaeon]